MLKGLALSPGIARGDAFVLALRLDLPIPRRTIEPGDIDGELRRLAEALDQAETELASLREIVAERIGVSAGEVFQAQASMLRDPVFLSQVSAAVQTRHTNVEAALAEVMEQFAAAVAVIPDVHLRERAADIREVGQRVLAILLNQESTSDLTVPPGSVLVTDDLLPSTIARLDFDNIRAVVMARGATTSHAAILIRSLEIPACGRIADAVERINTGDHLIVDGTAGLVFVNPQTAVVREYEQLQADLLAHREALAGLAPLPSVTADGVAVRLTANIGKLADTQAAMRFNADGIGLYRTEFAFAIRSTFPSEEEQVRILSDVAERVHPRPVTFRLLDLGADKTPPYFPLASAGNPALGERGLRLLLRHPGILETRLRAILRTSAHHRASILLPMVGGVEDVLRFEEVLEHVKQGLKARESPSTNASRSGP